MKNIGSAASKNNYLAVTINDWETRENVRKSSENV